MKRNSKKNNKKYKRKINKNYLNETFEEDYSFNYIRDIKPDEIDLNKSYDFINLQNSKIISKTNDINISNNNFSINNDNESNRIK